MSLLPATLPHALHALPRINDTEVLDDLEMAVVCLGDVHVHADVMLTGRHFRGTARPLGERGVVERPDDRILLQRAGLFHGSLPEPQTAVQA